MNNSYPKISIITPNFNQGEYLEYTIKSVLNQAYPNLEYIIIDGGSTDCSIDIIKKYEDKLAYWISEPDKGMYEAIQKGFDKSTGEIMAWINSDDMYHEKSLFIVAEIFDSFLNVNWLTGMNTFFDERGRCILSDLPTRITKFDYYQKRIEWIQQESTFWRRKLWNKAGGYINTELKYAGDFELWLRFFRTENLSFTSALLGGFRLRSSNQLSLNMLDKYYEEAYGCIEDEELKKSDIDLLRKKQENEKFIKLLKKTKIFDSRIVNKLSFKLKVDVDVIYFDRNKQVFCLNTETRLI